MWEWADSIIHSNVSSTKWKVTPARYDGGLKGTYDMSLPFVRLVHFHLCGDCKLHRHHSDGSCDGSIGNPTTRCRLAQGERAFMSSDSLWTTFPCCVPQKGYRPRTLVVLRLLQLLAGPGQVNQHQHLNTNQFTGYQP